MASPHSAPNPAETRPPPLERPHTTRRQAALWEELTPALRQLETTLAAPVARRDGPADAALLALVRRLQHDTLAVLGGEPEGPLVRSLKFRAPLGLVALRLLLGQLLLALERFRRRYHGEHPLAEGPAWFCADAWGRPEAFVGDESEPARSGIGPSSTAMAALREKLARRIDAQLAEMARARGIVPPEDGGPPWPDGAYTWPPRG